MSRPVEPPTPDNVHVQFDEESNQYVLRWYDPKSGELVRQIPVEALRRLAAQISRTLGLVVDQRL
ncbi:MAG: flagellar protein FlaG [Dehalococcoidia bacterium]|nr:flagellar protein FlaG [Dehalococcoidia bacterium]